MITCITGKIPYPTESAAQGAASAIYGQRVITLYPYVCTLCGAYHLTGCKPVDKKALIGAVQSGQATPIAKLSNYVTRFKYAVDGEEYIFLYLKKPKMVKIEHSPSFADELRGAVQDGRAKFIERISKRVARWQYLADSGHLYTFRYDVKHKDVIVEKDKA